LLKPAVPAREVISVRCPSCSEILDVDVTRERVIGHRKAGAVKADAKEGEDVIDAAMRNVKTAKERIQSEFEAAQEKLKHQSQRLDQLFRDAQKKVRETPDEEKPPKP
jgi:carbonic anhydrase